MTAPVVHYASAYTDRAITAAEAEEARAEDTTPPQWWRPAQTDVAVGHRHRCDLCDVTWNAPTDEPVPCWNCGPATEEGGVA